MKIYVRNMVTRGTRYLIIQEIESLGLCYNSFDLGTIDFKKDLSLKEISELDQSLSKYGLEITFADNDVLTEISSIINDLIEKSMPLWNRVSDYITLKIDLPFEFLNKCFMNDEGISIEEYYIEMSKGRGNNTDKLSLNIPAGSEMFNSTGKCA